MVSSKLAMMETSVMSYVSKTHTAFGTGVGPPGKGTEVLAFGPSVVESVTARVGVNRERLSQAERSAYRGTTTLSSTRRVYVGLKYFFYSSTARISSLCPSLGELSLNKGNQSLEDY